VYTGIGALCWLPDVRRWAGVVAALLRPGGRLFIRDGHPLLLAVDHAPGDRGLVLSKPYFEQAEPCLSDWDGTYVRTDAVFANTVTHWWNHGLGEIVTALLDAGMAITGLAEHDSVPWCAIGGMMERADDGEWRLAHAPARIPLTYTIQAIKRR